MEGISKCTQCHELGEEVKSSKCLDCHTEIKDLIENKRGYHASSEVTSKECFECHNEHHGRNFQIIRFDKDSFDHKKAGFELEGKHSKLDCEKCHQSKFIDNPEIKKKSNTFLGLDHKCKSCHEDFHQGTLSANCENCHNSESFRPAPKFKHEKAKFVLTGAHQKVDCVKCHKESELDGKKFQQFTNLKFSSCENCHKDPHTGKFGNNCESCHITASFKEISDLKKIDHNSTGFPLIGKHRFAECKSCHKTSLCTPLKHNNCYDCHEDYHKGAFTKEDKITDCEKCHTEKGFKPSTFTIEQHNISNFQLSGSHLAIPCQLCHKKNEDWDFRISGEKCIDCHKNIHNNEISRVFLGNDECQKCHNVEKWSKVDFDHSKTDFELLGKHQKIECRVCHFKETFSGQVIQLFSSAKKYCEFCHEDKHAGQFKKGDHSDCERCHTFQNWTPDRFDHNKTRFILDGAHSKVSCEKCHTPFEFKGKTYSKYKFDDVKCATCHS